MKRISKRLNHLRHEELVLAPTPYEPRGMTNTGAHFPEAARKRWRAQMEWLQRGHGRGLHRIPSNGRYDPVTITAVLDAILRIEPTSWMTAARLTEFLNARYPGLRWDSTTVGMILNKICDAAADKTQGEANPPLITWKVAGLSQYGQGGHAQAIQWLGAARDAMGRAAEQQTGDPRDPEIWNVIENLPPHATPSGDA